MIDRAHVRTSLGAGLPDRIALERLPTPATPWERLPFVLKILIEGAARRAGDGFVREEDIAAYLAWKPGAAAAASGEERELPFSPARVVLQDFTGVPAVVDLAALRDAARELGIDPERINPQVPADLVIDHSVQVDRWATAEALEQNVAKEYERNSERYQLLRWAQGAFDTFRVVPPGAGIVHQVNLESLATVVRVEETDGAPLAFPDTCVGTDSHTTMISGLGVLGFGVGGIEAEAVLLGEPLFAPLPKIVGLKLTGKLPAGTTATDLVLTVTERLRAHGVVGAYVEAFGDGLSTVSLADRATIANMSPEFGATTTLFPIDEITLDYLRVTGREDAQIALVETYAKAQGLWRVNGHEPLYDEVVEVSLSEIVPSLAGPRRPQDRVPLPNLGKSFEQNYPDRAGAKSHSAMVGGAAMRDGAVAIAAITSCTNTSNPSVMIASGLLARNAVARGMRVPVWVKTSLAPGSRVVTAYLERAGLLEPLATLGFTVAGYGCTTCIGNSGPLDQEVAAAVEREELLVAAVLSGNRNFEGRIHPAVRAAYLASPPLVVALALAGSVVTNLETDPIGNDRDGAPVYLRDIWPDDAEIASAVAAAADATLYRKSYADLFAGDARWQALRVPTGRTYEWDPTSTYIARPAFTENIPAVAVPITDVQEARALLLLGDSVTTDHISPAGSIRADSPAGRWMIARGVAAGDFNSYGARRGHDQVMMRGTFANIRLRNALAEGSEGPVTTHLPSGEVLAVADAAERYKKSGTPLIIIAGKEYGSGSSRDWAAKGTQMLGVRAVIAESYERIHRSNLIGMGILPLQFLPGESAASHALSGSERFTLKGLAEISPRGRVRLQVTASGAGDTIASDTRSIDLIVRLDGPMELATYREGGIMPAVLRRMAKQ
ncbi:MAG: aconitate hydratase AcnA [Candidatus Limnocylindrus sp.]